MGDVHPKNGSSSLLSGISQPRGSAGSPPLTVRHFVSGRGQFHRTSVAGGLPGAAGGRPAGGGA